MLKSPLLKAILEAILKKLKEHDADKLIKSSVIKCLGPIFHHIFSREDEAVQKNVLESALDKLQVEIDKGLVLNQIAHLHGDYQMKNSQK